MYIAFGVFMGVFIPLVAMTVVLIFYALFLCLGVIRLSNHHNPITTTWTRTRPHQTTNKQGLSEEELDKLPKVTGKDLVLATDCAVCLDEITQEQPARLVPGCNHGFHRECADQWLTRNAACPVCRAPVPNPLHTNNPA